MLAYGEHWTLNSLLNTLEKLNILIEDSENNIKIYLDKFKRDYLFKIKPIITDKEYDDLFDNKKMSSKIDLSQIKIFRDNLKQLIQDKANE